MGSSAGKRIFTPVDAASPFGGRHTDLLAAGWCERIKTSCHPTGEYPFLNHSLQRVVFFMEKALRIRLWGLKISMTFHHSLCVCPKRSYLSTPISPISIHIMLKRSIFSQRNLEFRFRYGTMYSRVSTHKDSSFFSNQLHRRNCAVQLIGNRQRLSVFLRENAGGRCILLTGFVGVICFWHLRLTG